MVLKAFEIHIISPFFKSTEGRLIFNNCSYIFCLIFQHLYPKSQIDVYVTILEDDGSALASSITLASLALADAAVQMFDTIVGISLVSCFFFFILLSTPLKFRFYAWTKSPIKHFKIFHMFAIRKHK